jgi:hypothetical protein
MCWLQEKSLFKKDAAVFIMKKWSWDAYLLLER